MIEVEYDADESTPAPRRLLGRSRSALPEGDVVGGLRKAGLLKFGIERSANGEGWLATPAEERVRALHLSLPDERPRPLVTVVTPVYNGRRFIEATLESIRSQTYDNVEHIVMDGGSTDGTLDVLREHEESIDLFVSRRDNGMYSAISDGFALARGEVLCWLNADDVLWPHALRVVVDVLQARADVQWLTGVPSHIDEVGRMINVEHPRSYFRWAIRRGWHRGNGLGFIQQESTFFRRALYERRLLRSELRLAADFHLWRDFAAIAPLFTVKSVLASFRIHPAQQSRDRDAYDRECGDFEKGWVPGPFWKLLRLAEIVSEHSVIRPASLSGARSG